MIACGNFTFNWILTVKTSLLCLLIQLKLTSHGILHYLWSADLSESFFQLILSILTFSQYFLNSFCQYLYFSIFFRKKISPWKSEWLTHIVYIVIIITLLLPYYYYYYYYFANIFLQNEFVYKYIYIYIYI